jgi:HPt (histidine-containing phosphotransfer) domain-containing protein
MFREREGDFEERFRAAREQGDMRAATRCAHDLKSVAGSLGMPELRLAAEELEAACEHHDANDGKVDLLLANVIRLLKPLRDLTEQANA